MQQPSQMHTRFKVGGVSVTPSSHVVVHSDESGMREAAELLVQYLAQLTPGHALQVVREETHIASMRLHAVPSNDGAACRLPLIVGRCERLSADLQWDLKAGNGESASRVTPAWIARTHTFSAHTFQPGAGSVVTTTELALHFFSVTQADEKVVARNTRAAVLWFAKEILACDITRTVVPASVESSSVSASSEPGRVLSPLPNAQLSVDRLNVGFSFPVDIDDTTEFDLVDFTEKLDLLVDAENASIDMDMSQLKQPPKATAPGDATTTSSTASEPSAPPTSSATAFTPSPSPPATISSLAPVAVSVEKHTPLQPLPMGAPRSGKPMIAVDLDEVLGEFVPPLIEFHNETYGSTFTLDDFTSYHFADVWGGSNEESQEKIAAFFKSPYFQDIPVIHGAVDAITALKERFDLTVVTSRQHSIESLTRSWLSRHFPGLFSAVLFGNHYGISGHVQSKPDMCRSIGAVALIDDSLVYARQCSHVLEKVFLFDRDGSYGWNENRGEPLPRNVVRCLSWAAVLDQLEDWQPTGELLTIDAEPE